MNNLIKQQRQGRLRQSAKGLTLVELSVVIAVLSIITIGTFSITNSLTNTFSAISEERYKTSIRTILNQYYLANLPSGTSNKTLLGASAPSVDTIAALDLYKYKGLGASDLKLEVDGAGNKWHYVACSTGGEVEHSHIVNTPSNATNPNDIFYCDIIAYTTDDGTTIANAVLDGKDISDWEEGVEKSTGDLKKVSDFVVVRGKPIVSQVVNDAWADIVKTRAAMEAYYLQQYEKNRELGIAVSRFANEPITVGNENLYDFQSIFRNTKSTDTKFNSSELFGLGLADDDSTTLLGEMLFDNGSAKVRHPEHATNYRPPYTVRIWYDLCQSPDCTTPNSVIIEGIASSGSP